MQAFEIGHFGRVPCLDQRFESGLDQMGDAAAQHRLLAEQVGLALFLEICLDNAAAATAHARGIGERNVIRRAPGVLVHRDPAWTAPPPSAYTDPGMARGP